MKKLLHLFVVLLVVTPIIFTSCSKDEEEGNDDPGSLVGTWLNTVVDGDFSETTELTFESDMTGEVFAQEFEGQDLVGSFTLYFTYATKDNNLTVYFIGVDDEQTLQYSVDGDKLTLSLEGEDDEVYTRK